MWAPAYLAAERSCKVICDCLPFEEEIPGPGIKKHEPCEVQRQSLGAEDAVVEGKAEAVGGDDVHA